MTAPQGSAGVVPLTFVEKSGAVVVRKPDAYIDDEFVITFD